MGKRRGVVPLRVGRRATGRRLPARERVDAGARQPETAGDVLDSRRRVSGGIGTGAARVLWREPGAAGRRGGGFGQSPAGSARLSEFGGVWRQIRGVRE